MTNEEVLKVFLKKHRKLTSYRKQLDKEIKKVDVYYAITTSFLWSESVEGFNFWADINTEWKKLCETFNLKYSIDMTKV